MEEVQPEEQPDIGEFDDIVAQLQQQAEQAAVRRDALREELLEMENRVRRIERAVSTLTGERMTPPGRAPTTASASKPPRPSRAKRNSISEERLKQIEGVIREFAQEQDEFRQVDVRASMPGVTSGTSAIAFEILRQRGILRVARVEGNSKFYRLTRQAVNGEGNGDEEE